MIDLTEQAGPLRYWQWIAGATVVIVGVAWWRKRAGSSSAAAAGSDQSMYAVGAGANSIDGLGGGGPGGAGAVTVPGGQTGPSTNLGWSTSAANDLIARGYDPNLTESALADYLAGSPLSTAEQSVVSLVLKGFGTPPEGVIPVHSVPQPAPAPAPTPTPTPAPEPSTPPASAPAVWTSPDYTPPPLDAQPTHSAGQAVTNPPPSPSFGGNVALPGYYGQTSMFWDGIRWIYT